MTILEQITESKKRELKHLKEAIPLKQLEKSEFFGRTCHSLHQALATAAHPSIIAEFKRKSPSGGIINDTVLVEDVTRAYVSAGVAGLSVLTDYPYFGGRGEDLICARIINACPILRKDFLVDEYQVYEAKAMGADIILLIAACLTPGKTFKMAGLARSLGMEVLLELHAEKELDHLNEYISFAGINNRNLKDFTVSLDSSLHLAQKLPAGLVKISESGLRSPETVNTLFKAGFKGFLMGEAFMSTPDPGAACHNFILSLQTQSNT